MAVKRMAEKVPRDKILKLNVGGVFYTTAKSTLTSVYGSRLWRIATGDISIMRDERGSLFLDRDGYVFRYVLNYLRTNKLIVPQGYKELHLLREEAEYFGLDELLGEIERVLSSRRRRYRPKLNRKFSRSIGSDMAKLCDENGSVIFDDDGSDWFYD